MAAWTPQIQTTQNATQRIGVKILLYGPPAVGKTPTIKSLTKPLLLAGEDGFASVTDAAIPYIQLNTKADVEGCTQWLKVPANIQQYDWIVLDSISQLTQKIYNDVCRLMPTVKDPRKIYGAMQDVVVGFLQELLALNKNILVIAWQGDEYAPNDGPFVRHIPTTKGQAVATYLMHYFDCTLHMALHQVQQQQADGTVQTVTQPFLQTQEFNRIFARTRAANKLQAYEPPDLTAIANKLKS